MVFSKKIKFIILFVFILFIYVLFFNCKAFNYSDLTSMGIDSSTKATIYSFIMDNRGNYDSVFVCYGWNDPQSFPQYPEYAIRCFFYNKADLGKLYTYTPPYNQLNYYTYMLQSQLSKTDAVHYIATGLYNTNDVYVDRYQSNVYTGIRNVGTGFVDTTVDPGLATNRDIYTSNAFTTKYFTASEVSLVTTYINPSFISTSADLTNFSDVEYLYIDPGDFDNSSVLKLYNTTTNTLLFQQKLTDFGDYMERIDPNNPFSRLIYAIPISKLPSFSISTNNNYEFRVVYTNENNQTAVSYVSFTPSVNADINNTTNSEIQNTLEQTNESINNINDTISDPSISDVSAGDLPSISVNDPTENGIDSIFTSLYNAFCTGEAQDIVFPIPYTNKSITLQANYIKNMLENNNATWVLTFIQAFWAFLFGRFIIKDMSEKIGKIKSGNIEELQNTNIKEEML